MLLQLLLFNWSTSTVTPHNFTKTTKSGSQSHRAKVCGNLQSFLLSLGMTTIKGDLFSSSPVRGAIELGCTTRQQNTEKIQIKARAHARVICYKALCQSIKGKKSKEVEGTCWTTFLLHREAGGNKICLY